MQDCPSVPIPCWPLVQTSWRCSVCASCYNVYNVSFWSQTASPRYHVHARRHNSHDYTSCSRCAPEQLLELFQCNFWGANVRPNREKYCSIPVSIQQLLFLFFKDHHNCSITMYLWFYAWSADLEGESLILNHHVSEPDTPDGLLHGKRQAV